MESVGRNGGLGGGGGGGGGGGVGGVGVGGGDRASGGRRAKWAVGGVTGAGHAEAGTPCPKRIDRLATSSMIASLYTLILIGF